MNSLIKDAETRHDAGIQCSGHQAHKDRGELLAVIRAVVDLCDESVLKGNVMEFADSHKAVRTDAIKALINGESK